jgi:hypothetical protein
MHMETEQYTLDGQWVIEVISGGEGRIEESPRIR